MLSSISRARIAGTGTEIERCKWVDSGRCFDRLIVNSFVFSFVFAVVLLTGLVTVYSFAGEGGDKSS